MGCAVEDNVFDASFTTDLLFLGAAAIGVDHKDVGTYLVEGGEEVEEAATFVDDGILDVFDGLHHEETFVFREHGLVVLVFKDGGIRTDADIEFTIFRRLTEEFDMATMKKVVAT